MDRRSAYVPSTGVVLVVILGSVGKISPLASSFARLLFLITLENSGSVDPCGSLHVVAETDGRETQQVGA